MATQRAFSCKNSAKICGNCRSWYRTNSYLEEEPIGECRYRKRLDLNYITSQGQICNINNMED
jgi:hypothetical protein